MENGDPKKKALYDRLVKIGYLDKKRTYDEFESTFNTEDQQRLLHEDLLSRDISGSDFPVFRANFFSNGVVQDAVKKKDDGGKESSISAGSADAPIVEEVSDVPANEITGDPPKDQKFSWDVNGQGEVALKPGSFATTQSKEEYKAQVQALNDQSLKDSRKRLDEITGGDLTIDALEYQKRLREKQTPGDVEYIDRANQRWTFTEHQKRWTDPKPDQKTIAQYEDEMAAISQYGIDLDASLSESIKGLKERYGEDALEEYGNNIDAINYLGGLMQEAGTDKEKQQKIWDQLKPLQEATKAMSEDPLLKRFKDTHDALRANYDKFKEMASRDDYALTREILADFQGYQKEKDLLSKTLPGSAMMNPAARLTMKYGEYAMDIGLKSMSKIVTGLMSIPRLLDTQTKGFNKKQDYNIATDGLGFFFDDLHQEIVGRHPTPSNLNRGLFEKITEFEGLQVTTDNQDNITSVRDKQGYIVDVPKPKESTDPKTGKLVKEKSFEERFAESPDKSNMEQTNWVALPYKSFEVLGDLGALVAGTQKFSGIFNVLTKNKSLAANAGLVSSVTAQMHNDAFRQAREAGGSISDAGKYALAISLGTGLVNTIFGLETRLATGQGSSSLAGALMQRLRGGISKQQVRATLGSVPKAQLWLGNALKESGGEIIEETFIEKAVEMLLQSAYDHTVGSDFNPSFDAREAKETAIVSGIVGIVGSAGTAGQAMNQYQKEALYVAAKNPEKYAQVIENMALMGNLPDLRPEDLLPGQERIRIDDHAENLKQRVETLAEQVASLPQNIGYEKAVEVTTLMDWRNTLQRQAEGSKVPAITTKLEEQIKKVDERIAEIYSLPENISEEPQLKFNLNGQQSAQEEEPQEDQTPGVEVKTEPGPATEEAETEGTGGEPVAAEEKPALELATQEEKAKIKEEAKTKTVPVVEKTPKPEEKPVVTEPVVSEVKPEKVEPEVPIKEERPGEPVKAEEAKVETDIERRRQEELNATGYSEHRQNIEQAKADLEREKANVEFGKQPGNEAYLERAEKAVAYHEKQIKILEEIKAKYDTEVAKAETETTIQSESSKDTKEAKPEPAKDTAVTPEKARETGTKTVEGNTYTRQEPITATKTGKAVNVGFGKNKKQEATYTLVEAEQVQPSHMQGNVNEMHFIPEAQPRNRGKGDAMAGAAKGKADKLDPEQLGQSPNAYFGAPVTNERGEVIQGNGRAEAIKVYHETNPEDTQGYREFLKANAEAFGIKPEDVDAMKAPVLVRMTKVSDQQAIELGNFDAAELEDVKRKNETSKKAVNRMKPEQVDAVADMLTRGAEEDTTLRALINNAGTKIIRKLQEIGVLREDAYDLYIADGKITTEGRDTVYDLIKGLLFKGLPPQVADVFEGLPHAIKMGIERALPSILRIPNEHGIADDVRMVVTGLADYLRFKQENELGGNAIQTWKSQTDMFRPAAQDIYSPEQIAMIDFLAHAKTQKEIAEKFKKIASDIQGQAPDIFNPEGTEGMTRAEAYSQNFNINIENDKADNTRTPETRDASKGEIDAKELGERLRASGTEAAFDPEGKSKREKDLDNSIKQLKKDFKGIWNSPDLSIGIPLLTPAYIKFYKSLVSVGVQALKNDIKNFGPWIKRVGIQSSKFVRDAWNSARHIFNQQNHDISKYQQLSMFESFRELIQNRDIAIQKLTNIYRKMGLPFSDDIDIYVRRELEVARAERQIKELREDIFGRETHKTGARKINSKSMIARAKAKGISYQDISDYLYAKHAPSRNARVEELTQRKRDLKIQELQDKIADELAKTVPVLGNVTRWSNELNAIVTGANTEFDVVTDGSGLSDTDAQDILDTFDAQGRTADLEAFANEFRDKVIKPRIELLESSGLITPEQADALRNGTREGFNTVMDGYVPLFVKDEYLDNRYPTSLQQAGSKVQKLKGTGAFDKAKRQDPMLMACLLMESTIRMAEQNRSKQALANMIRQQNDPNFWAVVSSARQVTLSPLGEIESVDDYTPQIVKDNSVQVAEAGKLKYLFFEPVRNHKNILEPHPVIRAMKRQPSHQNRAAEGFMGALRWVNSVKRNFLTAYNVAFGFPNFFRDVQDALANVSNVNQELDISGIRRGMIANIPKATKAIAQGIYGTNAGQMGAYWVEAQRNGMHMSWTKYADTEGQLKELEKHIKSITREPSAVKWSWKQVKAVADAFSTFNDVMENTTRLAAYGALRDAGISPQKAAAVAKNLTLNFEKKGTAGGFINTGWLFANAGIQGVARTAQMVTSKQGRIFMAGTMALAAANRALLLTFMDDDDIEHHIYNDLNSQNNIMIANPFDRSNPIMIPKPYSFVRLAMTLGEGITNVAMDKKTPTKAITDAMMSLQVVMDPIGGAQENLVSGFAPTVLKEAVEIYYNEAWHGNTIIPYYDKNKKDVLQFKENVAPWARSIAEYVESQTQWAPAGIGDWSPSNVEYAIKSLFGGAPTELIRVGEMINDAAEGSIKIKHVPILRRFYARLSENERVVLFNLYDVAERDVRVPGTGMTDSEKAYVQRGINIVANKDLSTRGHLTKTVNAINEKYGTNFTKPPPK